MGEHYRRRVCGGAVAAAVLIAGVACVPSEAGEASEAEEASQPREQTAQTGDIVEGAWRADRYVLASGPNHPLRGHIMFAGGDWNVLFFVLDEGGTPLRMSAEGGTYTLDGEDLVFTHLFFGAKGEAMDGLPETPFEMRALDGGGAEEAATVSVQGDAMTLFFPSGNQMTFTRAGRPS